jgi:hypothetical protein
MRAFHDRILEDGSIPRGPAGEDRALARRIFLGKVGPMRLSRLRLLVRGKHAFREIAFIVVGVLIALGANSWWEDRRDRAVATEYLLRLSEDLSATRAQLAEAEESGERVVGHTRAVLRLLRAGPGPESVDSLRAALGWVAVWNVMQVHNGTYEEMLASGTLRLLRSDSLRAALRAYQAALEYHQGAERYAMQLYHGRIEPFLTRHVVYSDVAALGYRAALEPSPFEHDYRALFRSVELWNLASLKLETELFLRFTGRELHTALGEAQRLVLKELRGIDPALADVAAEGAEPGRALDADDLRRFLEAEAGERGGSRP